MNRRLSLILLVAFCAAAVCSYLVYRAAVGQITKAHQNTTQLLLAKRDLPTGTVIRETDVAIGNWMGVPPRDAIFSQKAAVGRGVLSPLYQGEPISERRLAAVGSGGGLAATIRPGMRACAVKVDEVVGVAGFVVPGMRVDVIVSGRPPGTEGERGPQARTLLQNIEVLSAGTNIQKDTEGKPAQVQVVNLLVTPQQAELLSLATGSTRIQLVLRNPLDTDLSKTPEIAMSTLFADDSNHVVDKTKPVAVRPQPPKAEKVTSPTPPQIHMVEVLNGPKRTEEKFPVPPPSQ